MDIKKYLSKFKSLCQKYNHEYSDIELPSQKEVKMFEKEFEETFPDTLKEFILNCDFEINFSHNYLYSGLDSIALEWRSMKELLEGGELGGRIY